jgi:hypothetical protein
MKVIVKFLKFLCYSVIVVAEYLLMMLLDIVKQMKKAFQ